VKQRPEPENVVSCERPEKPQANFEQDYYDERVNRPFIHFFHTAAACSNHQLPFTSIEYPTTLPNYPQKSMSRIEAAVETSRILRGILGFWGTGRYQEKIP
jgi:hypothetical protein